VVRFPEGYRCEPLRKVHPRAKFDSGQPVVDDWLARHALQNQEKHLSVTQVLVAADGSLAGYYTIATGQVDFGGLPPEIAKSLPKRALPVAVLAWLGVDRRFQCEGLGTRLLAQALADCYNASHTFAFVAVILDCIDESAKAFYARWNFRELPGQPMRLFLSARALKAIVLPETGSRTR
jgi:GNAT superfamily N-acetyltransferase